MLLDWRLVRTWEKVSGFNGSLTLCVMLGVEILHSIARSGIARAATAMAPERTRQGPKSLLRYRHTRKALTEVVDSTRNTYVEEPTMGLAAPVLGTAEIACITVILYLDGEMPSISALTTFES